MVKNGLLKEGGIEIRKDLTAEWDKLVLNNEKNI